LFLCINQPDDNSSMASSSAQVKALISVLGRASVLEAGRWVETFVNAFLELHTFGTLAAYTDKTGSPTKKYDGFVDAIREDSVQEQNLMLLALGSIGKSLHQFSDQAEGYGFRKGTDKVSLTSFNCRQKGLW
jgi:hypothetical protein